MAAENNTPSEEESGAFGRKAAGYIQIRHSHPSRNVVRFALVGDVHGQFSAMLRGLEQWESHLAQHAENLDDGVPGTQIDFVLQVGDFECHRNEMDLMSMAAPARKRTLGDFCRVASGELQFRWPVYFIGGNHECYGWLDSPSSRPKNNRNVMPVAKNVFFLGRAGYLPLRFVTKIGSIEQPNEEEDAEEIIVGVLNVAFLSGIHRPDSFYERRPVACAEEFAAKSNKCWIGFNCYDLAALLDDEHEEENEDLVVSETSTSIVAQRALTVLNMTAMSSWQNIPLSEPDTKLLLRALTARKISACDLEAQYQKLFLHENVGVLTLGAFVDQVVRKLGGRSVPESLLRRRNCCDLLLTHDWPSGMVADAEGLRGSRPMGNDVCRELCMRLCPKVHACGHMHFPYRDEIFSSANSNAPKEMHLVAGKTQVCALSKVGLTHAITVMELNLETGEITELVGPHGAVTPGKVPDGADMSASDVDEEGAS